MQTTARDDIRAPMAAPSSLARAAVKSDAARPPEPAAAARSAKPAAPDRLRVEVASTLAQIEALGPAWTALDARMTNPLFFQSFGWCRFVARFHSRPDQAALQGRRVFTPHVVTLWSGGALQAVWPLQLRRATGSDLLVDLGDPVSQYSGALISPEADASAVAAGLLAAARTIDTADGLLLRKTHVGSPLAIELQRTGFAVGEADEAPFLNLKGFPTFDAFYQSLLAKTRRNVRSRRQKFEAAGKVEHVVCWGGKAVGDAVMAALDLKETWLDHNGLTSSAFADPAFRPMIAALAAGEASGVELVAMVLSLDGVPASIHWGFVSNTRYYLFMTARNQALDAHAPGKLHIDYALKDCYALGLEVYDLLAPADPYKREWSKSADQIRDYAVPFTWRGRLALDLWQRRLRPRAKQAFMRLPVGVRKRLV
jgi:CelD/BcsL family acetyltransferase involved in cellulose biosynthesis